MFSATPILLIGSILLFISIIGSKTSLKIGVPTLIIFLGIGMLAGTDGFGIQFDNTELTQVLGIVALNFILFSGGLETKIDQVRPVLKKGFSFARVVITGSRSTRVIDLTSGYFNISRTARPSPPPRTSTLSRRGAMDIIG